jgi:hypothetical protein
MFQARTGTVSIADQTLTTTPRRAPAITNVVASGKNLDVQGQNFDPGEFALINGVAQKNEARGSASLMGKKSVKNIATGRTVSVQVHPGDSPLPRMAFK